jgi:hypothetical protein
MYNIEFRVFFYLSIFPMQSFCSLASLAVCGIAFIAASCQTSVTPVDNSPGSLALNLAPMVGSRAFDTTSTFALNGRNIRFTLGQVYVSNITLTKSDGSTLKLTDTPISIRAAATGDTSAAIPISVTDRILFYQHQRADNSKVVAGVPTGSYTGISFTIGLTNPVNQIDASEVLRLAPQHPLALITSGAARNWWSWNSGYIFAKIEGLCDTSAAGTGTPDTRFFYHIGTTAFTSAVTLTRNFDVKANQTTTLPLMFDYARALAGVNLANAQDRSTMVIRPAASFPNERALAQRLVTNFSTAVVAQ